MSRRFQNGPARTQRSPYSDFPPSPAERDSPATPTITEARMEGDGSQAAALLERAEMLARTDEGH
jgi:hypothetical protein